LGIWEKPTFSEEKMQAADFIAFDTETATGRRHTSCQVDLFNYPGVYQKQKSMESFSKARLIQPG